jgi:hypothetical protein
MLPLMCSMLPVVSGVPPKTIERGLGMSESPAPSRRAYLTRGPLSTLPPVIADLRQVDQILHRTVSGSPRLPTIQLISQGANS